LLPLIKPKLEHTRIILILFFYIFFIIVLKNMYNTCSDEFYSTIGEH